MCTTETKFYLMHQVYHREVVTFCTKMIRTSACEDMKYDEMVAKTGCFFNTGSRRRMRGQTTVRRLYARNFVIMPKSYRTIIRVVCS